jgi:hypothetical protein
MIGWRKTYAIFSVSIYLIILFILLNYVEDNKYYGDDDGCPEEHSCVRFCSEKESFTNFSKVFIEDDPERIIEINEEGLIVHRDKWQHSTITTKNFSIYRNELECTHETIKPMDRDDGINFEFDAVNLKA